MDYAKETGLTQSTISRHLLDLSDYRRDLTEAGAGRKEGYGLVKAEVDPMELRAKRYQDRKDPTERSMGSSGTGVAGYALDFDFVVSQTALAS